MQTTKKQVKLYIIQKVLVRVIQKMQALPVWAILSNVTGISVKFWLLLLWPLTQYDHYHMTTDFENFKY